MLGITRAGPLGPSPNLDTDADADPCGGLPMEGSGTHAVGNAPPVDLESTLAANAPSDDERLAWAALVSVEGLGPVTLGALLAAFGSGRAVLEAACSAAGREAIGRIPAPGTLGRDLAARGDLVAGVANAALAEDGFRAELGRLGLHVVTIDEVAYPPALRAIELPPPVLFVQGSVDAIATPDAIAVVGTRRPSEGGRRIGARIAAAITRARGIVVSGLAVGIDGAAHAAAVAENGPTVAVLGSGHARLYPAAHQRLAAEIIRAGGAVLSEYAPSVGPTPGTFPRRNRVISGLARSTVVVEAGRHSGALITAAWALEQGRECFLVPGALDATELAGCLTFLRDHHGLARIVAGVPELLEDLGLAGRETAGVRGGGAGASNAAGLDALMLDLGQAEAVVAGALVGGAGTLDDLVAATSLAPASVLGALTLLEMRGLVVDALGRYRALGPLAGASPTQARRVRPRAKAAAAQGRTRDDDEVA